ncbi:hypothetical protein LINPERHAP1_LOCUS20689 [Linum perenne]
MEIPLETSTCSRSQ